MSKPLKLAPVVVLILIVAFAILALRQVTDTTTYCAGFFPSREQAEGAARTAKDAGFNSVEHIEENRGPRRQPYGVEATSHKSWDSAEELRKQWRMILSEYEGRQGHPGGGCWERGFGD